MKWKPRAGYELYWGWMEQIMVLSESKRLIDEEINRGTSSGFKWFLLSSSPLSQMRTKRLPPRNEKETNNIFLLILIFLQGFVRDGHNSAPSPRTESYWETPITECPHSQRYSINLPFPSKTSDPARLYCFLMLYTFLGKIFTRSHKEF